MGHFKLSPRSTQERPQNCPEIPQISINRTPFVVQVTGQSSALGDNPLNKQKVAGNILGRGIQILKTCLIQFAFYTGQPNVLILRKLVNPFKPTKWLSPH